jgi:hypothetical protein
MRRRGGTVKWAGFLKGAHTPAREEQEGQQCHGGDPATDELKREVGVTGSVGGHIGADRGHISFRGGLQRWRGGGRWRQR